MTKDFIQNIFKYFARFPDINAVLHHFKKEESKYFGADYTALKIEINTLDPQNRYPEIKNFLFSNEEYHIAEFIKNIETKFLIVDFGHIDQGLNNMDNENSKLFISLILCDRYHGRNMDYIERMMVFNQNQKLLNQIIKDIKDDTDDFCPINGKLVFPIQYIPVDPKSFYDSIGWMATLMWDEVTQL